mmetsp:Transcript_59296/g.157873  ORF Transcript_59296/g.157873 Transcript_59296/m.157873 type:complete len:128 (+) Transcript_59296:374-757(+)
MRLAACHHRAAKDGQSTQAKRNAASKSNADRHRPTSAHTTYDGFADLALNAPQARQRGSSTWKTRSATHSDIGKCGTAAPQPEQTAANVVQTPGVEENRLPDEGWNVDAAPNGPSAEKFLCEALLSS